MGPIKDLTGGENPLWKRGYFWAILVFLALGVMLTLNSCAAIGAPPVDANHDGVIDDAFVGYVAAAKGTVGAVTGGAFDTWLSLIEKVAIAGLGVYAYMTKKSIAVTDKNVETVAKAANVPDTHIL